MNAFSHNNLKIPELEKEYYKFPYKWIPLSGPIVKYCEYISVNHHLSSERMHNFCSIFASDPELYVKNVSENKKEGIDIDNDKTKKPKSDSKKEKETFFNDKINPDADHIVKRGEILSIFNKISKPHIIDAEKHITAIGIAAYICIYDDKDVPVKTTVLNSSLGTIYTKYIASRREQYFCFEWKTINIANDFLNNEFLGVNMAVRKRLSSDVHFHLHPIYKPSIDGGIITPLASTYDKYNELMFYKAEHRKSILFANKKNIVIENEKDLTPTDIDKLLSDTVMYADSMAQSKLLESLYPGRTQYTQDGDYCEMSPDREKTKELFYHRILEKENIVYLPPKHTAKNIHVPTPWDGLKDIESEFNTILERAMKHPSSLFKILAEVISAKGLTNFTLHTIKNMLNDHETSTIEIYSSFMTNLFHNLFAPLVSDVFKSTARKTERKNSSIKIDRFFDINRFIVRINIPKNRSDLPVSLAMTLYEMDTISAPEFSEIMKSNYNIKINPINTKVLVDEKARTIGHINTYAEFLKTNIITKEEFLTHIKDTVCKSIENKSQVDLLERLFMENKINVDKYCNSILLYIPQVHTSKETASKTQVLNVSQLADYNKNDNLIKF